MEPPMLPRPCGAMALRGGLRWGFSPAIELSPIDSNTGQRFSPSPLWGEGRGEGGCWLVSKVNDIALKGEGYRGCLSLKGEGLGRLSHLKGQKPARNVRRAVPAVFEDVSCILKDLAVIGPNLPPPYCWIFKGYYGIVRLCSRGRCQGSSSRFHTRYRSLRFLSFHFRLCGVPVLFFHLCGVPTLIFHLCGVPVSVC
jgi:hypothetical protein